MELYFLGTGAGMPSRERNVTSITLKLFEERGTFWLFDCGEGTQHQVLNSTIKLSKMEKLFITHLHGDHIYGIPGLLTSRSNQGGMAPLSIYGPQGTKTFIETTMSVSQARVEFEMEITEIDEGVIFQDDQFIVEARRLDHRIESFGFRITERDKPGKLQVEKLQQTGLPPGPIYAQIKAGVDVTLEDGTVIRAKEFVDPPIPGRIVVISGDTRVCEASRELSMHADVLVHEATFSSALQDLAYKYYHSTAGEVAQLAKDCHVKALIMTHISSRYQGRDVATLLDEATAIFPNSYIANDHWSYYVARKHSVTT